MIKKFYNWYISEWKQEWKMMLSGWILTMFVAVLISVFGPENNPKAIHGIDNYIYLGTILFATLPLWMAMAKAKNGEYNKDKK